MIKMNSISGLKFLVKDMEQTTAFYEALGFRMGDQTADSATCYVNWFWITFVAEKAEQQGPTEGQRGDGQFLYIKVGDVDEFYQAVLAKGMKPESEPQAGTSGKEFTLRDPNGYNLVFFFKK